MSQKLDQARIETQSRFDRMDEGIADLPGGAERVRLMRQVASLKAEAAPYMQDAQYRDFQRPAAPGRYQSLAGTDTQSAALKEAADVEVRRIAERYGLNGEATVERYSGGPPSKALADQYGAAEARERELSRSLRGDREETREQRDRALQRMHTEIAAVYQTAREEARSGPAVDAGVGLRTTAPPVRSTAVEADKARADRDTEAQRAETDRQERDEQQRKNAARKARERDGGRGL